MSEIGQKRTLERLYTMSALPPKADIATHCWNVRFTPESRHQRAQSIFLCFPTHHKNTEAFGFSLRNLGLQFRIVLLIKP